jgi:hypothetical protein
MDADIHNQPQHTNLPQDPREHAHRPRTIRIQGSRDEPLQHRAIDHISRPTHARTKLSGQVALRIPIGGSFDQPVNNGQFSGDVFSYGLGISYDLWRARTAVRVTPVLEFIGWNARGGSVTEASGLVDATNTNIANLKGGARIFFNTRDSVYLGYASRANPRWLVLGLPSARIPAHFLSDIGSVAETEVPWSRRNRYRYLPGI